MGIRNNIIKGYKYLYENGCKYISNVDSDLIMKKDWLSTLEKTHNDIIQSGFKEFILSGFNTTRGTHKIVKSYDTFNEKENIGGINYFFQNSLYKQIDRYLNMNVYQAWDNKLCEKCTKNGKTKV